MRILVVEDDALAGEMTAAVLEDGGCDVLVVETGHRALDVLAGDKSFDAVVSDMNMPGQSGLDLFRSLRACGYAMPFILLSGDDSQALLSQEPGLAACLAKDENMETSLMTAVAEALLPADNRR